MLVRISNSSYDEWTYEGSPKFVKERVGVDGKSRP